MKELFLNFPSLIVFLLTFIILSIVFYKASISTFDDEEKIYCFIAVFTSLLLAYPVSLPISVMLGFVDASILTTPLGIAGSLLLALFVFLGLLPFAASIYREIVLMKYRGEQREVNRLLRNLERERIRDRESWERSLARALRGDFPTRQTRHEEFDQPLQGRVDLTEEE